MTRKYKTIATIILVALLLAPLSAYGTLIVRADDGQGARFTNITTTLVETLPGGPIYYDLCFNASSPPTANGVLQIQRPDGSAISSPIVYTGRTCNFGAGYYFLQARFAGAQLSQTGGYQFLLACAAPGAGYTAPCLDPNTGLVTNFGGRTVGNSCQVNFTVGGATMGGPVNCYDGQGQPPTGPTNTPVPVAATNTPVPVAATNTPVPVATNTSVPAAGCPTNTPVPVPTSTSAPVATNTSVPVAAGCPTNTPVPVATNTSVPVATNTSVPVATNTSVPVPTNTPVPAPTNTSVPAPTNTSVPLPSGTDLPVLAPAVTPLPIVPGAPTATATPIPIGIAPGVPTNTPAPVGPTSTPGAASSHATATPTTVVRSIVKKSPVGKSGKAKARLRVTLVPATLQPGDVAHVSISYAPRTRLRVAATFPMPRPAVSPRAAATTSHHGKPSSRVAATPTATVTHSRRVKPAKHIAAATKVVTRTVMTDVHGHATVAITVPPRVRLSKGHATASIVVQSLNVRVPARATRKLAISDMLLSASAGPITLAGCVQTQLVKVRYYGNHTLRLVVMLAHGRRVTVPLRTDKSGAAATRLRLHYMDASSPVRVTLQAFNVRPGAYRMEQLTLRVKLPVSCQKKFSTDITVTG